MPPRKRLTTVERRAAILTAARAHFANTTFPDASIPAIAADSGSSQALVFHYFSTKAALHAAATHQDLEELALKQDTAIDQVAPGTSTRERVRILLLTYLDHLNTNPNLIAGPGEPANTLDVRDEARSDLVTRLTHLIGIGDFPRHTWALWGWVGFLDLVTRQWVELGCPEDARHALIDAALGALEGALGDWSV